MQDLSKLLEYAVEQRDKALSNNTELAELVKELKSLDAEANK